MSQIYVGIELKSSIKDGKSERFRKPVVSTMHAFEIELNFPYNIGIQLPLGIGTSHIRPEVDPLKSVGLHSDGFHQPIDLV